ncbi:MAG TPA: hypothetical protein VGH33_12195 [Isosphaeraceae bacterium]|jgi:hypothetical protein
MTIRWLMSLAGSAAVVFAAIRSEWGLVPLVILGPLCGAIVNQRSGGRSPVTWALLIVTLLATLIAPLIWFGEGHGLSSSAMSALRPGLTEGQVLRLAGRPSNITSFQKTDPKTWYYSRGTFCQICISFSADGSVTEIDHDH